MRLLYVAMTRAEQNSILSVRPLVEKLEAKEYPRSENGKLDKHTRLQAKNFQD